MDVPDDIKEQLKSIPLGKKLNLESKMNIREKFKASNRLKDLSDEAFEKESGVINEMKNMGTLEDAIQRMKFEDKRE